MHCDGLHGTVLCSRCLRTASRAKWEMGSCTAADRNRSAKSKPTLIHFRLSASCMVFLKSQQYFPRKTLIGCPTLKNLTSTRSNITKAPPSTCAVKNMLVLQAEGMHRYTDLGAEEGTKRYSILYLS